jgi:dTDP-4-amino-4,6-dideoxygalactose transaminase
MIPFNKPCITGRETHYITDAVNTGTLSGNGKYTKLCQRFMEEKYGFGKCLLTTSCTDALEMAAILIDIKPGDEVIVPSYTFVSTANAFVLRGAKIIFADSRSDHPGIDEAQLENLVTSKTKAIVPVHYAGVACDMDVIMDIANRHNLFVVEDAAQAIDSYYTGRDGVRRPLGSIGHFGAFSFHETKNIISGEGGMLVINDAYYHQRAEIIWEKGTNRSAFYRGEIDKYGWVDVGSSFLPSEVVAAFLWAQFENLDAIQSNRITIWNRYRDALIRFEERGLVRLPVVPDFATNNAHMFYLVCQTAEQRDKLITFLKQRDIQAVFHYLALHQSPYYKDKYQGAKLNNCEVFANNLVRLPFFNDLTQAEQNSVCDTLEAFFSEEG